MASDSTARRADGLRRMREAPVRPIVPGPKPDPGKPRYHAFDALRGMAMFLVVGLHAALGYLTHDIPGVLWCVRDAPSLPAFDWFCWWTMSVSNPLYFTIAGFFAADLYNSRGYHGFVVNRARRVGVPLCVGFATVMPACLLVWSVGWLIARRCNVGQIIRFHYKDKAIQAELFGPGHLWFLYYLVFMLLAYALIRRLVDEHGRGREAFRELADFVLASPWRALLLAVPTTAILWIGRERIGIDATMDRHNSPWIDPVRWAHYATFFLVGLGLHRMRHRLDGLSRTGPIFLALSVPVFIGRAWLLGRDLRAPLHGPPTVLLAVSGGLFAWLIVFGFLGTFQRVFKETSPALRYLADSSYWIYLIHMPILGLVQVDLSRVPGHALWKAPVVLAITLAIGFGTYQTMVRHTEIGAWLHGRRERSIP